MNQTHRVSSQREVLNVATSVAVTHNDGSWNDAREFGVAHQNPIPRVRDSLVLRLVAGKRQERHGTFNHATGVF